MGRRARFWYWRGMRIVLCMKNLVRWLFGRLEVDRGDLYATINGGFLKPDGVGGALFRIKLGDLAVV